MPGGSRIVRSGFSPEYLNWFSSAVSIKWPNALNDSDAMHSLSRQQTICVP